MHSGQEQFFTFILDRVCEDKKEAAGKLLQETFQRQADKQFTKEDLEAFNTKLLSMIQPSAQGEVADILSRFGAQHTS